MSRYRWLALALVLTMLAAACGGEVADDTAEDADPTDAAADDAADDAEEPADEEVDEPADEPADGEIALRWRTRPDNQAEIDVYSEVSETIDANWEEVSLSYEPGGSETSSYQDVLRTEIASGTAPDVFWIPGTDVADFATRGLILDLREIADASESYAGDDAYYEQVMELLTVNPEGDPGTSLWGVPRDVSAFALYLNMDLIEEAGAPDPRELAENGEWTWETFREVADAVAALDPEIAGFAMNNWWANPGYWINAAGGSFFNEDRTACAVDSEESIAGLEFMTQLYGDGITVPYGEDGEPPFLAGQVGMFMNGRWATPGTRASATFNWDTVKLPDGPGGPSNWLFWGAYVVNANTEHPEEAFDLVTRLTSGEIQGEIASLGANIPSRTDDPSVIDTFLTFTPPENTQAFVDGITENPVAEGPLWEGDWPAFDAALAPQIEALVAGDVTLEEFQSSVCGPLDATF